jgi:hypothetical protein
MASFLSARGEVAGEGLCLSRAATSRLCLAYNLKGCDKHSQGKIKGCGRKIFDAVISVCRRRIDYE